MIQRYNEKLPVCSYCLTAGHSAFKCSRKPRPAMNRGTSQLKTTKPMNRVGKVQKQTNDYVAKWKRTQKPNHAGYYTCYISGRQVDYLIAEHPFSKARHPDMRTNQTLEPVSNEVNELKGSMDIGDFLEKYPQYKATVKPEYL